jgi:ERCC4-type nuclease
MKLEMLTVGDYVVGEGFAVERKSFGDFLRSIYDKRLFDQMNRLRDAYAHTCLLIEGNTCYDLANLQNPFVFWGALSRLIADYETPIIYAINEDQSADFLFSLAKMQQLDGADSPVSRFKPKTLDLSQKQLLVVEGLPGIGPKMADLLLKNFKSVRRVFEAHSIEFRAIPGIGKKRERLITNLLDSPYQPRNS